MTSPWEMHAYLEDDGRLTTVGPEHYVRLHGFKEPIVPVLVEEVTDDSDVTHWGWMGAAYAHYKADTKPCMIWDRYMLFEMCFPYGVDAEVKAGRGRVVKLRVTQKAE